MAQVIHSMMVSLTWVLPDPLLLGAPGSTFGTREKYLQALAIPPDGKEKPPYVPPWQQRGGFSRLWAYYLGLDYVTAPGDRSWFHLVPLRGRRALAPEGAKEPRLWLYVWPHAVGAVLDIEVVTEGAARDQAVNRAIARATMQRYRFAPGPGRAADLPTMEGDAGEVVRRHAEWQLKAVGGDPARAVRPDRPFSITTVLAGEGGFDVPEGDASDATWRAVHGLACLNPRWATLSLHRVQEHRITSRAEEPGSDGGLYGVPRGRVVWLPRRFVDCDPGDESLWWYHRNLTELTMQVEAHLALVRWASPRLGRGQLTFEAGELVRHAARTLMRLYTGERQTTYRSASARRQVDDADVALVREVCDHFGVLPPAPSRALA